MIWFFTVIFFKPNERSKGSASFAWGIRVVWSFEIKTIFELIAFTAFMSLRK